MGFQSNADLDHFSRYVETEAHAQPVEEGRWRAFGRTVQAGAFPISTDRPLEHRRTRCDVLVVTGPGGPDGPGRMAARASVGCRP